MVRLISTLMLALLVLAGCATYPDVDRERLKTLPQHYSQFDVDVAWQVRSVGSQTTVDGELKSLRYQFMNDVEIWVAVLDAEGHTVARSVSYLIPYEIKINEVVPFSLRLPVAVAPGTRLRFTYNYSGSDGGDDKGGYRTQSFDSQVLYP
jgi:hypothetical protein